MKSLSFLVSLFLFYGFSAIANSSNLNGLTDDEKRLTIGSLYLSQCVIQTDISESFYDMSKQFDQKHISVFKRNSPDSAIFLDKQAITKVHLSKDTCAIEIFTHLHDELIASLPNLLGVNGGDVSVKKEAATTTGTVTIRGKNISITAYQTPLGEDFQSTVILKR